MELCHNCRERVERGNPVSIGTSLLLQKTVASALENNKKVFVSYFDVSRAFDTLLQIA